MTIGHVGSNVRAMTVLVVLILSGGLSPSVARAQQPGEPTFAKDIAPILQRSCQNCHRPGGVAPMSLVTYDDVRPWARAIKQRTGMGPRAGVMPPWYIEKNIGIQRFQDDPSLSAQEIAMVARWADAGAPAGNPADMPPARHFDDAAVWRIGKPDFIISTPVIVVKAGAPDWWGEMQNVRVEGLPEDRYVSALEMKEVNDIDPRNGSGRQTVGGRYVVHHLGFTTSESCDDEDPAKQTRWPVHEVGRNPDFFDPRAGRLLKAGGCASFSTHLHSNGRDTKAHIEIGFKFHPKGYTPLYNLKRFDYVGNGQDIDIQPMEANQQLHAYQVLDRPMKMTSYEPHLHAPGARMCLEAIWGINIQTLSCAGYDHNWVRGYTFADDAAPLLPAGTVLHLIGFMDNTPANKNVPDPRNWQGSGNRSVANMFVDLGDRVALTEEQFQAEMAQRRERLKLTANDVVIGCPLCNAVPKPGYTPAPPAATAAAAK